MLKRERGWLIKEKDFGEKRAYKAFKGGFYQSILQILRAVGKTVRTGGLIRERVVRRGSIFAECLQ